MKTGERDFTPELVFRFSRSGGAGGQHVNKVSTKAELSFDVEASVLLSTEEKELVKSRLSSFINAEGVLKITCQEKRSQLENREEAVEKFYRLLAKAFAKVKKRVPTRPGKASKARRLLGKKLHGMKKENRRKGSFDF